MLYILAILAALLLSAFQYLYKRKALWLFIWRFLVYSIILILLINPKWKRKKQIITKPDLYVLADNSLSIKLQGDDRSLRDFVSRLKESRLENKYNIHYFKFDDKLAGFDSLDFSGRQTAIGNALSGLRFLHRSDKYAPVVLLTDGRNTAGKDYVYGHHLPGSLKVFPVVFGDTMTYQDLRIDLVNANSYAYKDNFFPVEIFITGDIKQPVRAHLKIWEKDKVLFHKALSLSPKHDAAHITTKFKAGTTGLHHYKVVLSGLENEKNNLNNSYYFDVEVLKNAQKILILSNIIHPDIAAVKRSLKNYPFIRFDLKRTTDHFDISFYQSVILYQPDSKFNAVFGQLKKMHKTWWIITGKHTDWSFLNSQNLFFNRKTATSYENYFPQKNDGFSLFKLPELDLEKLPPLIDVYGQVKLSSATETAYYSKINGLTTKQPLLAFNTVEKQVVLLGENLWQWTMQAGVNGQKEAFDRLLFQIIQYLSIEKDYDRLQLHYKKQYYQAMPVIVTAKFLDKNLDFDEQVKPEMILYKDKQVETFPMILKDGFYQVQISDLTAGKYRFTVKNKDGSLKKNGFFRILPFSIEKQNLQADVKDLNRLARQTNGVLYFRGQANKLIQDLKDSNEFHASIRYETSETPLIDYKYLLFLLVILLSIEWLVKKLRGEL